MLFYSYFKTLVGKQVTVELKNDLAITGTLHSVDQYLNIKLNNVHVVNEQEVTRTWYDPFWITVIQLSRTPSKPLRINHSNYKVEIATAHLFSSFPATVSDTLLQF